MNLRHLPTAAFFSLTLAAPILNGCANPVESAHADPAEKRAVLLTEREQIEQIPPPSKSRYMAVHSYEGWQNPYLTVQAAMVTLHVLLADANSSPYGVGGMLRPIGARREEISVSPDKLAEAMSSIPSSAWPYGRVVAVEEAHKTPAKQEPVVRRNMEATVGTLNDLGIIAYDLAEGNLR